MGSRFSVEVRPPRSKLQRPFCKIKSAKIRKMLKRKSKRRKSGKKMRSTKKKKLNLITTAASSSTIECHVPATSLNNTSSRRRSNVASVLLLKFSCARFKVRAKSWLSKRLNRTRPTRAESYRFTKKCIIRTSFAYAMLTSSMTSAVEASQNLRPRKRKAAVTPMRKIRRKRKGRRAAKRNKRPCSIS